MATKEELKKQLTEIDWPEHSENVKSAIIELKYNLTKEQLEELLSLKVNKNLSGVCNALYNYHSIAVEEENEAKIEIPFWEPKIYEDIDDYCVNYYGEYLCESDNPEYLESEFEQYKKAVKLLRKWGYQEYIFNEDKYYGLYFVVSNPDDYSKAEKYSPSATWAQWLGENTGMKWWRVIAWNHETNEWDTIAEGESKC